MVSYDILKNHIVVASAQGYRRVKKQYEFEAGSSEIFFLDEDDGSPYIVMASGERNSNGTYIELRDKSMYFLQNIDDYLTLYLEADWGDNGIGTYELYQEAENGKDGKKLIFSENEITFSPTESFDIDKTIYIRMKAENGVCSDPISLNIIVSNMDNVLDSNMEEGVSEGDWLGSYDVGTNSVSSFVGRNFSISSPLVPVEVKIVVNDDGSITYRGVLGFYSGSYTAGILNNDNKGTNSTYTWSGLKKQIQDYRTAGNASSYFKNLMNKYNGFTCPTQATASFSFAVNTIGYFEYCVARDGSVISSDGGLIVDCSAGISIGATVMAGVIPVYCEINPSVSMSLDMGLSFYDAETGTNVKVQFNGLTLQLPSISMEAGVGIQGLASVGVTGSGRLTVKMSSSSDEQVSKSSTKGLIGLSTGIRIRLLFIIDFTWTFLAKEFTIWESEAMQFLKNDSGNVKADGTDAGELSIASRDYLNDRSRWNGVMKKPKTVDNESEQNSDASTTLQTLQTGVLPDAMPQIYTVGDQQIMLFLQDLPDRAAGNNTQLVYSVYDGNKWSSPQAVWDTDTADYFFNAAVDGDTLYVAWQKAKSEISENSAEELLNSAIVGSEIAYAKWDNEKKCFIEQKYVTANDTLDMYPNIDANDGEVSVVWMNTDSLDITLSDGNKKIMKAVSGHEEEFRTQTVYETDNYIEELSVGYGGVSSTILLAEQTNDEDTFRVLLLDETGENKLDVQSMPTAVQYENGSYYWQCENGMFRYDISTGNIEELISSEEYVVSSSFKYISNENQSAIVWSSAMDSDDGNGTEIKACILRDGKWSKPVTLYEDADMNLTYMAADMTEDEFILVMNTAQGDEESVTDTELVFARIPCVPDLELTEAVVNQADYDKGIQEISLCLNNLGTTQINTARVTVTSGEKTLMSGDIELSLMPGESEYIDVPADISQLTSPSEAVVIIETDGDGNLNNNKQTVKVAHVDAKLSIDTYEKNESMLFVVTVSNDSPVAATSKVYITEGDENGTILKTESLGAITDDQNASFIYIVKKQDIDYSNIDSTIRCFRLVTEENDWSDLDNTEKYIVSAPIKKSANPDGDMEDVNIVQPVSVQIGENEVYFESPDSESIQLTANIMPENSTISKVVWSVENQDIVYLSDDGKVTPLREGSTVITAQIANGATDKITVEVGADVEKLNSDTTLSMLALDDGIDIYPEFEPTVREYTAVVPENTSMIMVTAEVNDATATVKGNGVRSVKEGDNDIYVAVTAEDGTKNSYLITVTREESIENSESESSQSGSSAEENEADAGITDGETTDNNRTGEISSNGSTVNGITANEGTSGGNESNGNTSGGNAVNESNTNKSTESKTSTVNSGNTESAYKTNLSYSSAKSPATDDSTETYLHIMALLISAACGLSLILHRRRKKKFMH